MKRQVKQDDFIRRIAPHVKRVLVATARKSGVAIDDIAHEITKALFSDSKPGALYLDMLPAELAQFNRAEKRIFLYPEELLRMMAFQAVREIESEGRVTLTHIESNGTKRAVRVLSA